MLTIASPAIASADCPASIGMADFHAIGSVHRTGQYIVELDMSGRQPLSIQLTAGTDGGSTFPFSASDITFDETFKANSGARLVLVTFPSGGIRWFRIDSVQDGAGITVSCSHGEIYSLPADLYSTDQSFDDSARSAGSNPTVIELSGPTITAKAEPEYPVLAQEDNIEGTVEVLLTVHIDGSAGEFTVLKSSGSALLDDAALTAVKRTPYAPAHLPQSMGGAPIEAKCVFVFTFKLSR